MKVLGKRMLSWLLTFAMVLVMAPTPFTYGAVEIAQQDIGVEE